IGVSESSLKRWADGGRLQVTRTMGGHRRIALLEAVRFVRESHLPIVKPELLGIDSLSGSPRKATPSNAAELLSGFLERGESTEARSLLVDLYLEGKSVAWLCDGPLRYAMQQIGEKWHDDPSGIYQEHRALDISVQALSYLRVLLAGPRLEDDADPKPVAIGGAPEGDPYVLGSLASSCVAAESGYQDINLGAHLPLDSLVKAAREHNARLAWLSCSSPAVVPSPKQIDALGQELETFGARLVVGGQASPRGGGRSDNVRVCDSMAEFGAFVSGLISA
ncbi:MAG: hypothetical protein AAGL98_13720, partial [Planctomycetota bacterium]